MKKLIGLMAFAVSIGLSGAAPAAELSNMIGATCDGEGTWHFVNNQARVRYAGTLTAIFSSGECEVDASHVNQATQHFFCYTSGLATLEGASTNLPGRLVLSDLDCRGTCKPEAEICGDGIDNDCDGLIDEDCKCEPTPEVCDDKADNDCDGLVDGDDPDCQSPK